MSTAAADGALDLLSNFRSDLGITANLPGTTVIRVRGALQFDPTGAASYQQGTLLGMIVEPSTTAAANVPRPSTSEGADWMMYTWAPLSMAWEGGIPSGDRYGVAIDVKSRRRLDEIQETLWLVHEQTQTADTAQVYGWVSVLLALP